jgi:hypothetical protein
VPRKAGWRNAHFFFGKLRLVEEPEPLSRSVDFVLRRTQILKKQTDEIADLRKRAELVVGEMMLREIEWLVLCGWPQDKAYMPALNNIALRGRAVAEELKAGIARIQKEARERLARLEEEFRDDAA